jgi:hypothetical protein
MNLVIGTIPLPVSRNGDRRSVFFPSGLQLLPNRPPFLPLCEPLFRFPMRANHRSDFSGSRHSVLAAQPDHNPEMLVSDLPK